MTTSDERMPEVAVKKKSENTKRASKDDDPSWNAKYDYKVDYNDHFETPLNAYTDILPLLDSLAEQKDGPNRKEHILYDPYYCNGRTKGLLRSLGFEKTIHEKRDFYKDIRQNKVPQHHTLVTNPPYSDDHKERCLQFCVDQFREHKIAFFLLIPNYVASRQYYRKILGETVHDVAYLVPPSEYSYSHPEGTGHEKSPFSSLWFCGIGRERIREWQKINNKSPPYETTASIQRSGHHDKTFKLDSSTLNRPFLVTSYEELVELGVISLQNRPNPRQRKKFRKLATTHPVASSFIQMKKQSVQSKKEENVPKKKATKSKYRNKDGSRTKKRF